MRRQGVELEAIDSYGVSLCLVLQFGLQVQLPTALIFNRLQDTRSCCDAGVTQLNGVGRKLGLRLLKNRLAHEIGKRANQAPLARETSRTRYRNT
jgi:hypothetical protein